MARRKRIPYDPPSERRKKGRSGPPRRADQIFMTRRMFLAKGGIVAAFAALAAKLGYMQVNQRDVYRTKARDNYVKSERLKATRGMIYDRADKELAVNRRAWQVRVIPADLPRDEAERARVLNHLIAELGLPDALVLDPSDVPSEFEEAVYARTHRLLGKPTLDVQITDQAARQPVLAIPGQLLRVNGQDFQVFVYPSAGERQADARRAGVEGALDPTKLVDWELPPQVKFRPHSVSVGNVLGLLISEDEQLIAGVERGLALLDGDASAPARHTLEEVAETLRTAGLTRWRSYITQTARINNLVALEDALTPDQAAVCRAHLNEIPGVHVMNVLEYRITNVGLDSRRPVVAKSDVPRELALKLEANRLYLPGVSLDNAALVRRYPGGEAMSHILGYVGRIDAETLEADKEANGEDKAFYVEDDVIGVEGLEWTMEQMLRGHKGKRWVEVDPSGFVQRTIPGDGSPAVPGKNLKLTIDLELQEAVSRALKQGIEYANDHRRAEGKLDERYPADNGAIVVLDPRNGEVLALASYPHFDNQLFADGISQAKFDEYANNNAKPLLNHAIMETFPPGSTLKLFHAASALHDSKITTEDTFNCTGAIFVPFSNNQTDGNHYYCWNKAGHQRLNVYDALKESCDIFFYNVGAPKQRPEGMTEDLHYYEENGETSIIEFGQPHYFRGLGIDKIKKNLTEQFWFGARTEIDLPGEQPGDVPDQQWLYDQGSTDGWSVGDTINVSIGQGYFKTTPLQLAVNTAAIANGGHILKPQLVRQAFDDARQNVQSFEAQILRKLDVAQSHMDVVKEGMRRVVHVEGGSAAPLDGKSRWPLTNPDGEEEILIAGKTGTAEIGVSDEAGKYDRQNAWFTGFAPLDNPEVVVTLVIHDGGGSSTYAVPVADKVMRAYFELTGRRKRGKMLTGEDGSPPDPTVTTPTPEAAPAEGQA